jgi:signal transduction histidine kinase
MLEAQHIRSMIVMPITLRDQFWGFIGFHACQTDRQWRPEEESILSAMAGSIGGAIARKHAEEDLIRTNNDLQEILDDLQRTQTQLVRSEKLAALGQLIAGIAHEINTPLGAIRSSIGDISTTVNETLEQLPEFLHALPEDHREAFFTLLKQAQQKNITLSSRQERQLKRTLVNMLKDLELKNARKIAEMLVNIGVHDNIQPFLPLLQAPDYNRTLTMVYRLAGLQESAQTITTAVDRASKVVFALKTYARRGAAGEMLETDISEGIETVLTLYHNQLKHGVEVVRQYTPLPPILCYPDELNQVWTNLIHNALQAMDYKGTLTLTVEQEHDHAMVSISDTGTGIPEEIATQIFEPFFTTKPPGEGSGMGLDIVRKIIDKHQGAIHVESQPGHTTFFVQLPMKRKHG